MNKQEFNKKCAGYMELRIIEPDEENESITGIYCRGKANDSSDYEHFFSSLKFIYNPHDDLNQLAEVFDKAFTAYADDPSVYSERELDGFLNRAYDKGIKQALRDFLTEQLGADNE